MTIHPSKQHRHPSTLVRVFTRPMGPAQLGVICAVVVGVVGVVDLVTANINLAILYAIPVIMVAQTDRKSLVGSMAISAIILTYAGYLIGPRPEPGASLADLLQSYRLLNRTFCAAALLAIAALTVLYVNAHCRLSNLRDDMADADHELHSEVLWFFDRMTAMTVCVVLVVWVALMDFLSPRAFNVSILYIVPLAGMTWVRSRRLLWTLVAILLLCTWIGYTLSLSHRPQDAWPAPALLRNRFLAVLALLACAALLHFAMHRPQNPSDRRPGVNGASRRRVEWRMDSALN